MRASRHVLLQDAVRGYRLLILLVWKKYQLPYERHPQQVSFREWRDGDLVVRGARLHGAHAAIDVLLPLIAVSLGLTAMIGIVFAIVRATVA